VSLRPKWISRRKIGDSDSQQPRGVNVSTRGWLALAAVLVVVCSVAPVVVAHGTASRNAKESRRAFDASSAEVASTLQLAIHDEQSLVVNGSAFVLGNPSATNADLARWLTTVQAFKRYPELVGLGKVVIVPHSKLAEFTARARIDPVGSGGRFQLSPPGHRSYYCLLSLGTARSNAVPPPVGLDYCALPTAAVLLRARDSGKVSYSPAPVTKTFTSLGVQVPTYRGGAVPAGVSARRRAFVGWFAMSLDPTLVLHRALNGHPGMAVSMRYRLNGSDVTFRSGKIAHDARSATIDLHNGWTVKTYAAPVTAGMFADGEALRLLVGGIVLSLLLGILFFILGTGRARAWSLVEKKTQLLRHQALHDGLTGLPNRALIIDRVEQALARARRYESAVAVMFLDLDGFKDVNDSSGHDAGDQLLRAVGDRLTGVLRDSDTVGRLGGDEFVVVVEGDSLDAGPEVIAERIRDVLAAPFHLGDDNEITIHSGTSIGIAVGMRTSASELVRDADIALYEAKGAGKGCFVVFAPEMQAAVQQRLDLETDLRQAVGTDQFFLAYQPTFDLTTNTVTGVEALIRWQHPTRGVLMPGDFIAIAEETALIIPIGRWVLHEACRQAAAWHHAGHPLGIAVNISGRQLDDDSLLLNVQAALTDSGIEPHLLTLEITETMLMRDTNASARRLTALKHIGVRLAIDDFGTGYSSMAYLQQFPVDALKIDRSFISGVAQNAESAALIHTMVQLGKALGLETLGEGIEEPEQLQGLLHEQCDSGQGYLLARPLTPEALEQLIQATPKIPAA
jgi:diguanylate cyclase (GGDEF)-like protein